MCVFDGEINILTYFQPYRDDEKDCVKLYSNPDMFFEIWSQQIMKKMEQERTKRKKEQRERKRQREAAQKPKQEAEAKAAKTAQDTKVITTAVRPS